MARSADPYLWLEAIDAPRAMRWVKARNAETVAAFTRAPRFRRLQRGIREVLDSRDRIPFVEQRGGLLYNLWEDARHPRGVWRRTTPREYAKADPTWEVLLDIDALGKREGESWVWAGVESLRPDHRRCLISLSRAGADATVVRELDLESRQFVAGGFVLPEAKQHVGWIDLDRLFVATDFGRGSMTSSGYPRIVKRWRRGTPLSQAEEVFAGEHGDLTVSAWHDPTPGFERDWVVRTLGFYRSETYLLDEHNRLRGLDVPLDSEVSACREWLLVQLRSDWRIGGKPHRAGSLLITRFDAFLAGERDFRVAFAPTPSSSLSSVSWTRHLLFLNVQDHVASRVEHLSPDSGAWKPRRLRGTPALSTVEAWAVDRYERDDVWVRTSGFLTPTELKRGPLRKQLPGLFDATRFRVTQSFATSADGTRVPYFMIAPRQRRGPSPTLLYGYGGFEVSLRPEYSAGVGRSWLEPGGVYVVANIRGGGEYGPGWHQAALREKRARAYEDFEAVAEDLIARGITTPQKLVAQGGSNGGLLIGNMLARRPELFAGLLCEVPLLDMRRYTRLSAGASWIAEYGDPDLAADWAFLQAFSPYQRVTRDRRYPPILFTTSTRDDRVGPAHARKMAARMRELGHEAWFYENIEGGHGEAADHAQKAFMTALGYAFLWRCVGR